MNTDDLKHYRIFQLKGKPKILMVDWMHNVIAHVVKAEEYAKSLGFDPTAVVRNDNPFLGICFFGFVAECTNPPAGWKMGKKPDNRFWQPNLKTKEGRLAQKVLDSFYIEPVDMNTPLKEAGITHRCLYATGPLPNFWGSSEAPNYLFILTSCKQDAVCMNPDFHEWSKGDFVKYVVEMEESDEKE